jgi:aspartyl-tRNA(Asn)/glutamyl-tRNA(Gln) amidotransferase subunit A
VFGRSVADAALLLQVIAGHDPLDSTCARRSVPDSCRGAPRQPRGKVVVGVPREYFPDELDPARCADACR